MASATQQEGLFQTPSSQLPASLLPPTSLLLDCSVLSVLWNKWILGVSREGGREQGFRQRRKGRADVRTPS